MHFAELEPLLDRKRAQFIEALSGFEPHELQIAPKGGGWNVIEVIEHVGILEERIVSELEALLASEAPRPPEPIDNKIVDMISVLRTHGFLEVKVDAPEWAIPTGSVDYEEGLARLAAVRAKLKSLLPKLASRETNSMHSRHMLGFELNPCQWAQFAAVHENIHLRQLRRIREQLSAARA